MSASEKLKALGEKFPDGPNTKSVAESLIIALPQIVAVVEALEEIVALEDQSPLELAIAQPALAALEEALS